jgi:integrase
MAMATWPAQHHACERIRARAAIADFNPHELRRTVGTTMAELGVPRFIVERVLNHTDRAVTSVYGPYRYSTEKMAAVRKLGAFVDRMATRHRTQARMMRLLAIIRAIVGYVERPRA